jgi:carbamoylphosphate synthase small subunit
VANAKEILGKKPVFGICMGHQILGQAFGGKTFKLKFGHHGGNHPIRYNPTGKHASDNIDWNCAESSYSHMSSYQDVLKSAPRTITLLLTRPLCLRVWK